MLKQTFVEGLWTRNVASVQLLGLCPLLAVSYNIRNAVGLSIASAFVLIMSSLAVASMRKLIPENVRLPCFVLVIATLTSIVVSFMQAFAYDIYVQIALFVQIIVTNCMILGHIEFVASKEPVPIAVSNAIGTALGFSIALLVLGAVRQALTMWVPVMGHPAGAFFVMGLSLAALNCINVAKQSTPRH